MNYLQRYNYWCNSNCFDENTKSELLKIKDDDNEIKERFYKELEFGTGGLRGIIGAGSNRMNIYTVRKATQGIANFINSNYETNKKVAIAYDSRNMSKEFALETALCFNANGIMTYLFDSLSSTPELSFAVRYLDCSMGIVITASHNPAKYNGYKVYSKGGAQITYPLDKQIIECVNNVDDYNKIKTIDKQTAINDGLFKYVPHEVVDKFIEHIKSIKHTNVDLTSEKEDLKIVYSPLHGAGHIPVKRALHESGYKNLHIVEEQKHPDGNFPTVKFPNPEEHSAFELAIKLAEEKDADIIVATDPDADRLGVYTKGHNGEYISFSGNLIASLMAQYILSQREESNTLPDNGVLIKTIVTTNLLNEIASNYDVEVKELLTGFKYIGEKINEYEETQEYEYVFGAEESYGYLADTHVRDKDAISSVKVLCEMVAYYKKQNKKLIEVAYEMYDKYGYYKEDLIYVTLDGVEGAKKIASIMKKVRDNYPTKIGNQKVISVRDYKISKEFDIKTKEEKEIDLLKSDVLYFTFENNGFCCLRPSGTEPKIKLYVSVKGKTEEDATEILEDIKKGLKEYLV